MSISPDNISKPTPRWYKRMNNFIVIGLIPVTVLAIKGLWVGSDVELNKILLIITTVLPGVIKSIGFLLTDENDGQAL